MSLLLAGRIFLERRALHAAELAPNKLGVEDPKRLEALDWAPNRLGVELAPKRLPDDAGAPNKLADDAPNREALLAGAPNRLHMQMKMMLLVLPVQI